MGDQQLLTPEQVGERLQLSRYTILDYLRHGHPNGGKLRGFKTGKQWRIRERDLQEFIEANLSNQATESNGARPRPVLVAPVDQEAAPHSIPYPLRSPERRAALLVRLHAMQAEGMTHQQIANQLNHEREPTLSGRGRWTSGAVGKLLAE